MKVQLFDGKLFIYSAYNSLLKTRNTTFVEVIRYKFHDRVN